MDGTRLRSAGYPARLALVRLRAAPGRAALVALGIATGAAMLALSVGGSVAVRDRAVAEELARIGPSESSLQVVWSGVPAQASVPVAALDRAARSALTSIVPGRPFGVSLFRQASFGGAFVNLGGVDGLARWVRLRSGRLPRACTPTRCELVLVGGSGAVPRLPFLHVVGRGTLSRDAPLHAYFGDRGAGAPPLLLADGALALLGPGFRAFGRVRGPLPVRLAALSLARRGGTAIVAAAFLVVSIGVALFAVSYRATLERGQRDQAAFAVPADYIVSEDLERLVPIQAVAPGAFAKLGDSTQVLRAAGDVRGTSVTLLGLSAHALAQIQGWRDEPAANVLRALGPTAEQRGFALRSRELALRVTLRGRPRDRTSSPAASSSASRSPRRSPTGRGSSSRTSRPASSTRRTRTLRTG